MRVRDLIEKLKQMDEMAEVVVIDDREPNYPPSVFWIQDVAIDSIGDFRVVDLRFTERPV